MRFPTAPAAAARLGAAALLAAAAGLAAAGRPAHAQAAAPPARLTAADSAAVARARADSARLPYTAADVRFMQSMIAHHAQAVRMSRLAPARAASGSVRTLAERIINAQQDEIAIMQRWLRDRLQPVPTVHPDGTVTEPGMPAHGAAAHGAAAHGAAAHGAAAHGAAGPGAAGHAHGHAHGHDHGEHRGMPGMLTEAELAELAAARGEDFDRRFLQSMIRHHRGATAMVKTLFATTGAGQDEAVFKFATDVNVDQTTEIARMQRMLAELLFGAPLTR